MVSNRRVLFLYKLEINRIERIYRFKRGTVCPRPNVKVLGKPLETDMGITAPRYTRGGRHITSCFRCE